MVNRVQGYEIHLPGFPPTVHANTALFGLDDDTTNPALNRYYKTTKTCPGLWISPSIGSIRSSKKKSAKLITDLPLGRKRGSLYPDWYELDSGDVNLNFIYNP
jgi:hypothetical protein